MGVCDDGVGAGAVVGQRELVDAAIGVDVAHLPGGDLDEPDRVGGRGDADWSGIGGGKRVDPHVSVDIESSDAVGLVEREPERAVGASRDHRGHRAAVGQGEFGHVSVSGYACDLIGAHGGEPQCVVGADGDPEWGAPGLDRESGGLAACCNASDPVVAWAGEP